MPRAKWWILVPLLLFVTYLIGPRPQTPVFEPVLPPVPSQPAMLEQYVNVNESKHKLRSNNEARIVWFDDSARNKTEYVVLYLHGFSASQAEGDPIHRDIARKFGCNMYLSRLAEHGIDTTEKMVNLTPERLWESACEAYAIASRLGNKVVVMGTSTGGTLALMLASSFPEIHSLILLSPNIEIFDGTAWLLNNPWGLQIARMVTGSDYIFSEDTRPEYKQYWSYGYRIEAVVALEELLETAMQEPVFKKVTQPVLMLYYFKSPEQQDSVVKVEAMHRMFAQLGTPEHLKMAVAVPEAGNHVIGSWIKSKDVEGVKKQIDLFMRKVLKMEYFPTFADAAQDSISG